MEHEEIIMSDIVGYARVSTTGQTLEVQLDKLKQYGCTKIYQEKRSGVTNNRPQLKACLDYLREGDTLVVTMLDRMARSTNHLTSMAEDLKQRGVELVVIDQSIDTSTITGKFLFDMLAAVAEFETGIRKERQLMGIAKAKENGVQFGAKAKLTPEQIIQLKERRAKGEQVKDLMKAFGIGKTTVYRLLNDD